MSCGFGNSTRLSLAWWVFLWTYYLQLNSSKNVTFWCCSWSCLPTCLVTPWPDVALITRCWAGAVVFLLPVRPGWGLKVPNLSLEPSMWISTMFSGSSLPASCHHSSQLSYEKGIEMAKTSNQPVIPQFVEAVTQSMDIKYVTIRNPRLYGDHWALSRSCLKVPHLHRGMRKIPVLVNRENCLPFPTSQAHSEELP